MQVLIDAEGMMKVTHMVQMPNLQHENWGAMPSGHDSSQQVELLSSFWHRSSDLKSILVSIHCFPPELSLCWHLSAEAVMLALLARLSAAWGLVKARSMCAMCPM